MSHRLHVLKIPTTWQSDVFEENLFPYTHYSDAGHNPRMTVHAEGEQVLLRCSDRVKLHPNYAQTLRNRADIYMPGNGAAGLALAIIAITGPGDVAELANVDPEGARRGPQTLPYIREARRVICSSFRASIAGCVIEGGGTPLYIDNEAPKEGHVEMMGPEVHLGIPLFKVSGRLDVGQVQDVHLWCPPSRRNVQERRQDGVLRPAPTTAATVDIRLEAVHGARLAACLLHYAKAHEREMSATG